jgi:steroid delta-isomerase-like uncharacterized protein
MSVEENKAISRRDVDEGFNKGNLAALDQIYASNHVNHDNLPGLPNKVEGLKQFIGMYMYRVAFPDLNTKIDLQIAEGDRVVTHWTATGTNKGSLMGMPATNKRATITGTTIERFAGGKIVETRNTFDQVGMMQQLGVIPAPGR